MKRVLIATIIALSMATSASAQSARPDFDPPVALGACAALMTASGAALGITMAVPGAGAALVLLTIMCTIVAVGG